MTKVLQLATVAALTLAALSAQAASEPAVIYDTAGKFDKSFNEAVFRNGVEVYNKDKGVKVKEFEPQNEAQREQACVVWPAVATAPSSPSASTWVPR